MVSALNFQVGYCVFESHSVQDSSQTISMPSSYSMCPGLSIKALADRQRHQVCMGDP